MKTSPKSDAPVLVRHNGRAYLRTGKTGTDRVTGRCTAEYADENDARLWRDSEGQITPA